MAHLVQVRYYAPMMQFLCDTDAKVVCVTCGVYEREAVMESGIG